MRRIHKRLFTALVISFSTFWIVGVIAGGSAVDGKVEDSRYYLASHGRYTEVSRSTYIACAVLEIVWTAIAAFVLFLFFLLTCSMKVEAWIAKWAIALFIGVLCFAFCWWFLISLRCILRVFGIK